MHSITYSVEGRETEYRLGGKASWRVVIGSSFDADIVVRLPGVAAQHAIVWAQDGKVFVEPAAHDAAVEVNGAPIDFPSRLRDGAGFSVNGVVFGVQRDAEESSGNPEERGDTVRDVEPPREEYDQTVVFASRQRSQASTQAASRVMLDGDSIEIHRGTEGPGAIDDPAISRRHAELRRDSEGWIVKDLSSTNGTFVNGERAAQSTRLAIGDVVAFGPLLFEVTRRSLRAVSSGDGLRIDALNLTKTVRHRDTGQPLNLIKDVSLSIEPGEFVAFLGSSGCGKSTLIDAINGRRRATAGRVLLDGRDLYREFPSLKRAIGYVPQQVIYHELLSVDAILRHAAHIRLPSDTKKKELDRRIGEVLEQVGLSERQHTPAEALSGGQKKRVSIAVELLSMPKVLFLDEVTSGLDMKTEREMMSLFRTLADGGLTVLCITHHLDSLSKCHHVAYFFRGKLAFFGPPAEFCEHFAIDHPGDVYEQEEGASPEEWAARYERSPNGGRYLMERLARSRESEQSTGQGPSEAVGAEKTSLSAERTGLQITSLTRRSIALVFADRATLIVTALLAPVIGLIMGFAAEAWPTVAGAQAMTASVMAITTVFFFGLFTSTREIVKELPIYLHERMNGLEIVPYLISKSVPLLVINAIQVLVFCAILRSMTDLSDVGSFPEIFAVLVATASAGTMCGLAISALVERVDTAVTLMIFAVVPQMLFSGNLGPMPQPQEGIAAAVITSYWGYDAAQSLLDIPVNPAASLGTGQPLRGRQPLPSAAVASAAGVPPPPTGIGDGKWVLPTLIIVGQSAVLAVVTFFLLLRRDGSGAIVRFLSGAGRIIQAQATDDRIRFGDWLRGAGRGIRKV